MKIKAIYVINGGDGYQKTYDTPQEATAAMEALYKEKGKEYKICNLHVRSVNEFCPESSLVYYNGSMDDYHHYDLKTVMEPIDEGGSFKITGVHRDDLEVAGFDASNVDDATMERLASRMSDDYLEQLFWVHLPIIAEYLDIPRKEGEEESEEEDDEE